MTYENPKQEIERLHARIKYLVDSEHKLLSKRHAAEDRNPKTTANFSSHYMRFQERALIEELRMPPERRPSRVMTTTVNTAYVPPYFTGTATAFTQAVGMQNTYAGACGGMLGQQAQTNANPPALLANPSVTEESLLDKVKAALGMASKKPQS